MKDLFLRKNSRKNFCHVGCTVVPALWNRNRNRNWNRRNRNFLTSGTGTETVTEQGLFTSLL
jgi:hypothetical protein